MSARYIVGIDLGTTNSAVAFAELEAADPIVTVFPVSQFTAAGELTPRDVLPSFSYQISEEEFASGALRLPWQAEDPTFMVGAFARDHGGEVPGRLVASAKSWLCHSGVDRLSPLLPWHGASGVPRVSPVDASARYLAHIRAAWNHTYPNDPLEHQEVIVTVPASFDEVARELTLKAAEKAGILAPTVFEEPQAAFYSWLHEKGGVTVRPGQLVLVCDVGGGTTDFTLIECREEAGQPTQFRRVAVGEHLILGGDNMDLALAHFAERKVMTHGGKLNPRRWGQLVQAARRAKELMLGAQAPAETAISISGGAKLIGDSLQATVLQEEVNTLLLDGFFPRVGGDAKPQKARSGVQEFGLPYAADSAVTRYLADFLTRHGPFIGAEHTPMARPHWILLNGGVFESPVLRERFLSVLNGWAQASAPGSAPVGVLPNERLDLAVARGAVCFGLARHGRGHRIAGGLSRAYYVGVTHGEEAQPKAVCLAPAGLEEGRAVELSERQFQLRVGQPVEFSLYSSAARHADKPGDLLPLDEQFVRLQPIRTVIRPEEGGTMATIPVRLNVRLTEIGKLDVWCAALEGGGKWQLEFDARFAMRAAANVSPSQESATRLTVSGVTVERAQAVIRDTFRQSGDQGVLPARLVRQLEETLALSRDQWPLSALRRFGETILEVEAGRRLNVELEGRWLNLLGFVMRPGYGYPLDDWRMEQVWSLYEQGPWHRDNEQCRAEWWILWRRMAGGVNGDRQWTLADTLIDLLRPYSNDMFSVRKPPRRLQPHEKAEAWRVLGALERVPNEWKSEVGGWLLAHLDKKRLEPVLRKACWWALGRIGARELEYGTLDMVLPPDTVAPWLTHVIQKAPEENTDAALAVMLLARRTDDRYRDIEPELRAGVAAWLERAQAPAHYVTLVRDGGALDQQEQQFVFSESLPPGLHLC